MVFAAHLAIFQIYIDEFDAHDMWSDGKETIVMAIIKY